MRLYYAPRTRSFRVLWMLEELGMPYTLHRLDLQAGEHKGADYLAFNPMGKVPALVDNDVVVLESAAICAYLADKHREAQLAPPIGSPERGAYLRWMFFSVGCIEPVFTDRLLKRESPPFNVAWGSFDSVVSVLSDALATGPYLLGDWFTAADIMIGSMVHWATHADLLPGNAVFSDYMERLGQLPALQRALSIDAAV